MKQFLLICILASSFVTSSVIAGSHDHHEGAHTVWSRTVQIKQGPEGMQKAMAIAKALQKAAHDAGIKMLIATPLSGNPFELTFIVEADTMQNLVKDGEKLQQHPEWEKAFKQAAESNLFGNTYDFWSFIE